MTDVEYKILKKIVGQGYKLKAQHSNADWREALENAEQLVMDEKKRRKDLEVKD